MRALLLLAIGAVAMAAPAVSRFTDLTGQSNAVSPGDVIILYGQGMGGALSVANQQPYPVQIGNTQVQCNGIASPLLYVSDGQVAVQVPWELVTQTQLSVVVSVGGVPSTPLTLALAPYAPAIVSADGTGSGQGAIRNDSDGTLAAPASQAGARPTKPGEIFDIPAVGLGFVTQGPPTGFAAGAAFPGVPILRPVVLIGGVPAPIVYDGLYWGQLGVQLLRVQLPVNAPAGDALPVQVVSNGVMSNIVTMATAASTGVNIYVSPTAATAPLSSSFQFQYVVSGSSNRGLNWSIDADAHSIPNIYMSFGSVNNGIYQTPSSLPSPQSLLIKAQSQADPTMVATALVTLQPTGAQHVTILPQNPVVALGETVHFQAVYDDGSAAAVGWAVSNGFGSSSSADYTAPSVYPGSSPIQVTALASNGQYNIVIASTLIFLVPGTPAITSVSPAAIHRGDAMTITGNHLFAQNPVVMLSGANGTISVPATYDGASGTVSLVVPRGAVSGPMTVQVDSTGTVPLTSPPYPLSIQPRLHLVPQSNLLGAGDYTQVNVAFLGDNRPLPLTWSADAGSIDANGVFRAPQSGSYARIHACVTGTQNCATTVIALQEFVLTPRVANVAAGGSLLLSLEPALEGTWSMITGNGSVEATGMFHAGATAIDGGVAEVSAAYATADVNVTGLGPGVLSRTYSYYDWLGPDDNSLYGRAPLGTHTQQVFRWGNYAYVSASSIPWWLEGPDQYRWIDVYDLTDPSQPRWVTAIDCPTNVQFILQQNGRLYVGGFDAGMPGTTPLNGQLSIYDLSLGYPTLVSSQTFPFFSSANAGNPYGTTLYFANPQSSAGIQAWNVATDLAPQAVQFDSLPALGNVSSVIGNARFLFVSFFNTDGPAPTYPIAVFDATAQPAHFLGTLQGNSNGSQLRIVGNLLISGTAVFRIDGAFPVQTAASLTNYGMFDADETGMRLILSGAAGIQVADLSDPDHPRFSAATGSLGNGSFALGDSFYLGAGGEGGLETFPILWQPAPAFKSSFSGFNTPFQQIVKDRYVYVAESPEYNVNTIFQIFDLASDPAQLVGSYDDASQAGLSEQVAGNYVYLGGSANVTILDVSNPAAPRKAGSIPVNASAMALSENLLAICSFANDGAVGTLELYDITNPLAPRQLGTVALAAGAITAQLRNNLLYVALGDAGLAIYDVSNPAAPVRVGSSSIECYDVAVLNTTAFLASGRSGVTAFDVSNPRVPGFPYLMPLAESPGNLNPPEAYSLALAGNVLYVGSGGNESALFTLDVRTISSMRVIQYTSFDFYGDVILSIAMYGSDVLIGRPGETNSIYRQDMSEPINVGRYAIRQSYPGAVLPDLSASSNQPPLAQNRTKSTAAKWRLLSERFR